jgi:hypothetical protein
MIYDSFYGSSGKLIMDLARLETERRHLRRLRNGNNNDGCNDNNNNNGFLLCNRRLVSAQRKVVMMDGQAVWKVVGAGITTAFSERLWAIQCWSSFAPDREPSLPNGKLSTLDDDANLPSVIYKMETVARDDTAEGAA